MVYRLPPRLLMGSGTLSCVFSLFSSLMLLLLLLLLLLSLMPSSLFLSALTLTGVPDLVLLYHSCLQFAPLHNIVL